MKFKNIKRIQILLGSSPISKFSYHMSIPHTPNPMMRNALLAIPLHLLHEVIEEKIYQNRVYSGGGVEPNDFAPDELDGPYAAASKLNFPAVARFEGYEVADAAFEGGGVGQTA